jgi:hypothetical protein
MHMQGKQVLAVSGNPETIFESQIKNRPPERPV